MKREKENRRRAASCKPQAASFELRATSCKLQAESCGLRAVSHGPRTASCELQAEKRKSELRRNIPVRCTSGANRISSAINIPGALHLPRQIVNTASITTAASLRKIYSTTSCKLQAASFELRASSFEPRVESQGLRAVSGQENLFVNLCKTSVSSVVKKELNTERKAASCKPQAASFELRASSFEPRAAGPLRLCAFAPLREKELNTERKATSCKLQAASGNFFTTENTKKTQRNTEKNKNFVALCGTSVNSPDCTSGQVVVEENLNTEKKAASRELQAESCEPREKNSLRLCASAVNNSSTTPGIRNPQPVTCNPQLAAIKKYSPAVLHSFTANSGALYGIFINDCPGTAAITYFFTPQSSSRGTLKFNHHPCNNSHCLISPTAGRTGSGLIRRNAMA
jgi:hypothetical protein